MFFFEPAPTPYDLRFRLLRTPVRVHPMFWVLSAALGWGGGPQAAPGGLFLPALLLWVVACFISILIHEMGHIFMGRLFGTDGHVVLYSFGGLAVGSNAVDNGAKRALVSLAGPLAQFLLLGVVLVLTWSFILPPEVHPLLTLDRHLPGRFFAAIELSPYHDLVRDFIIDLIEINLFWPILNLLPIWPLDGGQIFRELCVGLSRERGTNISLGISLLVSGVLAVNALIPAIGKGPPPIPVIGGLFAGGWFMVIFFGIMALQSLKALQSLDAEKRWQNRHWDD